MTTETLSLTDLADRAGVTPRTVRYYIQQGLLPAPVGSGPGAHYGESHLSRLRLVRRLQREHLPLAEIRRRLHDLDDRQVDALVSAPDESTRAAGGSAVDYIRGLLGQERTAIQPVGPAPAEPPLRRPEPEARSMAPPPPPPPPAQAARPAAATLPPAPASMKRADPASFFRSVLPRSAPALPAAAPPPPPPLERPEQGPERSQWDRIGITPDIELHVRRPLTRHHNRLVERLLAAGRQFLEEDPS